MARSELEERCALRVGRLLPDSVTPPVEGHGVLGRLKSEEDDDKTKDDPRVESTRQDVDICVVRERW